MDFREDSYGERMRAQLGGIDAASTRRPIILPWLLWFATVVLVIGGVVVLSGCATESFSGVCALKPIGQDERGLTYVMAYCEPK